MKDEKQRGNGEKVKSKKGVKKGKLAQEDDYVKIDVAINKLG